MARSNVSLHALTVKVTTHPLCMHHCVLYAHHCVQYVSKKPTYPCHAEISLPTDSNLACVSRTRCAPNPAIRNPQKTPKPSQVVHQCVPAAGKVVESQSRHTHMHTHAYSVRRQLVQTTYKGGMHRDAHPQRRWREREQAHHATTAAVPNPVVSAGPDK